MDRKRARMRLAALLTALMALAAACGGGDAEESTEPTEGGDAAATEGAAAEETPADAAEEDTEAAAEDTEAAPEGGGEPTTLSFIWFEWPPAQLLEDFANENYPEENPNVTIEVDTVPIAQWHDAMFTQFAAQQTDFDVAILDSQWMGEAVEGGHVTDLTEWANENIDLEAYPPNLLSAYGQYPRSPDGLYDPEGSLYGLPALADSYVMMYRKDLIPEPPTTFTETVEVAAQCQEENEGMYGLAFHGAGGLDEAAVMMNMMIWAYGGEIWDSEQFQVEGIINSPEAQEGLDVLVNEMVPLSPPGFAGTAFIAEVNAAMSQGQTCIGFNWVAGLEGVQDPANSTLGETEEEILEVLGFAPMPEEVTDDLSLGGMGLSVSSYTEQEQEVLEFIEWFQRPEIQEAWGAFGGVPATTAALESDAFQDARPWNPAFAESYDRIRDFWNMPEYFELLQIHNSTANGAITGTIPAEEALDQIATQQQPIMDEIESGESSDL